MFNDPTYMARLFAGDLAAHGFVTSFGTYDDHLTVEVRGTDDRTVVVVPLYDPFADNEDNWLFLVRRGTEWLPHPDVDGENGPFGAPEVWAEELTLDPTCWMDTFETFLLNNGLGMALGVLPGDAAGSFNRSPYPGARPVGSWVVDTDGTMFPTIPDPEAKSGFSVVDRRGNLTCLNDWLTAHDAEPMEFRVPVLAYGANACPSTAAARMNGPVVALECTTIDLAAVWCHDPHGTTPSTLAHMPGTVENHVLTYLAEDDVERLDRFEGRSSGWYVLVSLTEGTIRRHDGRMFTGVYAYVGAAETRSPLVNPSGATVRVADITHVEAREAGVDANYARRDPDWVGPVRLGQPTPTSVDEAVRVFVYGTLQPGQPRWLALAPYTVGTATRTSVMGELYDTGHGYPALTRGSGPVPGYVLTLNPDRVDDALDLLDRIEGTEVGLYTRVEVHLSDGSPAWTYLAGPDLPLRTRIAAWPTQKAS